MSLFNMAVGMDPLAGFVLITLGYDTKEKAATIPRLRDAYIDPGESEPPILVILTRTGGGNRESYREENERLRESAYFVGDHDDSFDSTFAHWRYRIPDGQDANVADVIAQARKANWEFPKPMERFQKALDNLKAPG